MFGPELYIPIWYIHSLKNGQILKSRIYVFIYTYIYIYWYKSKKIKNKKKKKLADFKVAKIKFWTI